MITNSSALPGRPLIAFLFHPLLDTVAYPPMPDLSEAVWGGLAVLVWWKLAQSRNRGTALGWSALLGAIIYIIESNRLTGVFIVACAARLHPALRAEGISAGSCWRECSRWPSMRLKLPSTNSLWRLAAQSARQSAAARGKGNGSDRVLVFALPLPRYSLEGEQSAGSLLLPAGRRRNLGCSGGRESRLGTLPAILSARRRRQPPSPARVPLGRVVVLWFITLYLAVRLRAAGASGTWRPIVRDADRFLCSLTIPFSVLAATGLYWLLRQPWLRQHRWTRVANINGQPGGRGGVSPADCRHLARGLVISARSRKCAATCKACRMGRRSSPMT